MPKSKSSAPKASAARATRSRVDGQAHALDRRLFIVDNYMLLRAMNNEVVDLIVTDPPFKNRGTWVGKLDPPLSKRERAYELDRLASWGITNEREAEASNVDWPSDEYHARYKDIWKW